MMSGLAHLVSKGHTAMNGGFDVLFRREVGGKPVDAKDSETMARHLIEVYQWTGTGGKLLDVRQGESCPRWLSDLPS